MLVKKYKKKHPYSMFNGDTCWHFVTFMLFAATISSNTVLFDGSKLSPYL